MVFSEYCSIEYDKNCDVFYPGEIVSGVIKLDLEKKKSFEDIVLRSLGEAKCKWVEKKGGGRYAIYVTYKRVEQYFKNYNSLFDDTFKRIDGSVVLPKGEHKLRFSFQLPNGIPASFVGDYGKIAYTIKVTAKRETRFDKSVSWDFTVNNIINLSDDPLNKLPINENLSHEFCSLVSNKGTFSMNVNIPLAGYLPGQEIIIDCDINNENSQVSVEDILYTFRKITTFKADGPGDSFKVRKETIFNGSGEGVKKGLKSRQILKIELPDSLLPSLQNKKCPITVEYFIKIKAVSSGMHMDFKKYIPINIGTIPVAENMFRNPGPHISTLTPPCLGFSIPPSSPSLAKPPPTYEESLILLADMQLENKDNEPSSSLHTDGD